MTPFLLRINWMAKSKEIDHLIKFAIQLILVIHRVHFKVKILHFTEVKPVSGRDYFPSLSKTKYMTVSAISFGKATNE